MGMAGVLLIHWSSTRQDSKDEEHFIAAGTHYIEKVRSFLMYHEITEQSSKELVKPQTAIVHVDKHKRYLSSL